MSYQFEVLIAKNQRGLHQTQNIVNIQVLTMITILVYPIANRLTKFAGAFVLCICIMLCLVLLVWKKRLSKRKEKHNQHIRFLDLLIMSLIIVARQTEIYTPQTH